MTRGIHKRSEETRKRISVSQTGSKNSNWVSRLPVNLDDEEIKKVFSYLVGYWIGDGGKTSKTVTFAVRDNDKYIQNLVDKVSSIFGRKVRYRYTAKSCSLFFYSEVNLLKDRIVEEIQEKKVIKEYPWHFVTGFLDSDGWISYWNCKGNDDRNISICVGNTNLNYVLLLEEILDHNFIPYNIRPGNEYLRGYKPSWTLKIATNAGMYLVSHKIISITIDEKKREKCKEFIEYFDEVHKNQKIPICETFVSLQGEGSNTGKIQFFIRAATCDMSCKICDSKYSWKKGKKRTLQSLVEEVVDSGAKSVCLTGGEIAQFRNRLIALIGMLRVHDIDIVLQTNGLHYYRGFELIQTVSMDMKTPCTGEKSNEELLSKLKSKDEIKTLISDMKDYEYAVKLNQLTKRLGIRQILQPLNLVGQDSMQSLLDKYKWICEMVIKDKRWGENVRIIPQMHVFLWGNKRGV